MSSNVALVSEGAGIVLCTSSDEKHPAINIIDGYVDLGITSSVVVMIILFSVPRDCIHRK